MFNRKYKMTGWLVVIGAVIVGVWQTDAIKEQLAKLGINL
jgi:hypothetical protein